MTQFLKTAEEVNSFTGILLFSAPWCGPCKTYKPVLEAYCLERGLALGIVNVDVSVELTKEHGIRSVPTTFYFNNGTALRGARGAMTTAALKAFAG